MPHLRLRARELHSDRSQLTQACAFRGLRPMGVGETFELLVALGAPLNRSGLLRGCVRWVRLLGLHEWCGCGVEFLEKSKGSLQGPDEKQLIESTARKIDLLRRRDDRSTTSAPNFGARLSSSISGNSGVAPRFGNPGFLGPAKRRRCVSVHSQRENRYGEHNS